MIKKINPKIIELMFLMKPIMKPWSIDGGNRCNCPFNNKKIRCFYLGSENNKKFFVTILAKSLNIDDPGLPQTEYYCDNLYPKILEAIKKKYAK